MPQIRESKVHSCIFQQKVAEQKLEPNPYKKCRCRKQITFEDAKLMVRWGEAKWVVKKRQFVERDRICDKCKDETPFKATCDTCKGTGKIKFISLVDDPGLDIVLNAHHTKSARVSTPRVPTVESKHILRAYVPTEIRQMVQAALSEREGSWGNNEKTGEIEFMHLENVSPTQRRLAAERIEEYGELIGWQLHEVGARVGVKITGKANADQREIHQGSPEPKEERRAYPPGTITFKDGSTNKSWWWVTEGRAGDYGRAL